MTDDINVSFGGEPIPGFENPKDVVVAELITDDGAQSRLDSITDDVVPELYLEDPDFDNMTDEEIEEFQRKWIDKHFPLPEDFPSKEKLNEWKKAFGKIMVRRIAPGEAYVLKAIMRGDFKKYLNAIQNFKGSEIELKLYQEDLLVEICSLWPVITVDEIENGSSPVSIAGTVSILATDIQEISNMITDLIGPIEEL